MVRADRRAVPPSVPVGASRAPPGLKRFGWVQTFFLAAIACSAFGWKAHDLISGYPTKLELAAEVAGRVELESTLRKQAIDAVLVRVGALEDAGAREGLHAVQLEKRVDAIERKRPRPLSTLPGVPPL